MTQLKNKCILGLKITFVLALLYFLIRNGFLSIQATQEALRHWEYILPALAISIFSSVMGAVRWNWLLQAQNIQLSPFNVFQLTFIGNFFNIALPGAVSGDFVKAFYIGRQTEGVRTRAFGSILFDRVAGLSALVCVSSGALLFNLRHYLHSPMLKAIGVLVGTAALCVVLFYGYLFLVKDHHDPVLRLFKVIEKRFHKLNLMTRIYESLKHYHHHRLIVLRVLTLSIGIHLLAGTSCLCLARAMGETHLTWSSILIVMPLGLLVTAIPVAPAGVGTGNVAFFYFFQLIGSQKGADIYSLVALMNILIGAFGGIIYSRYKSQHGGAVAETAVQAPVKRSHDVHSIGS